ncbi:MAG: zonular occludens toxin domain-containing protein [Planctomycetota bacterium]
MASRSVITVTTGEAGSGKSFARCAQFLLDRYLKDHDGVHWSNFPLGEVPEDHKVPPEYEGETFVDRLAASASKLHGLDEEVLRGRVQLIPEGELARWRSGESGPWEFFEDRDLQDAHIAIDECHNYVPAKGNAQMRQRWQEWLGEIRHQGATVEFISQALMKVAKEIRDEAGLHIEVKNTETERDPFFGIELGDWYELRAGFLTRRYSSCVMERERRSASGVGRFWTAKRIFPLDPWYFRFYDSFSAPQKGGNKGRAQRRQFERRSRLGLLGWFVANNFARLAARLAFLAAVGWLLFGQYVGLGGGPWVVEKGIERMKGYGSNYSDSGAQALQGEDANDGERNGRRALTVAQASTSPTADVASRLAAQTAAPSTPAQVTAAVLELREAIDALEAENKFLRSVIDRTSELAAIGPDSVTFRNGFTYKVGEVIDYGPFAGTTIENILWRQRAALLDDGTILRMGGRGDGPASQQLLDAARGDANGGS